VKVEKSKKSTDQDNSAHMLRHDKSLSSHKFSEYKEDKEGAHDVNKLPNFLDINDLLDNKKELKKSTSFHSGSSSSCILQHQPSIAIIESSTPRKDRELQVSKVKSAPFPVQSSNKKG
jgi:hypothetical protein